MHIEDDDEPGFHRTDTTDFGGPFLSGNMALELDDGAEVFAVSRRCPSGEWNSPPFGAWLGIVPATPGVFPHRSP